jgi:hypothetical protein
MYCPGCAQLTHESDLVCPYCATPLTIIRENFQGQPKINPTRIRLKKLGIIFCALTFIWPVFLAFLSEITETLWNKELPLMDPLAILTALFLLTGVTLLVYMRAVYPLPASLLASNDSFFRQLRRRLFKTDNLNNTPSFAATATYLANPGYDSNSLYHNEKMALPSGSLIAVSAPTVVNSLSHPLAEVASSPTTKLNKLTTDPQHSVVESEPVLENTSTKL